MDLVLVRVQAPKVLNKKLMPHFTANSGGRPFVVLKSNGAYCEIFDDDKLNCWVEHSNNLRHFNNGKYDKEKLKSFVYQNKSMFDYPIHIPQNKHDLEINTKKTFDPNRGISFQKQKHPFILLNQLQVRFQIIT